MTASPPPARVVGPITRTDIVRYQGASGDFNPIHHDDDVARGVGYPSAFAPGMLSAGLLAGFASDWLGTARLRRISFRFRDQVWPGDRLVLSGEVLATRADGTVEVALECRRMDGPVVLTGRAAFAAADDGGEG